MSVTLKKIVPVLVVMFFLAGCHKHDEPDHGGSNHGQNDSIIEGDCLEGHGYVDLGLPSGTLWATCNVGADSPEELGDYFSWGETLPKEVYDWKSYQYGNAFDDRFEMTKYCTLSDWGLDGFVDSLSVLELGDDAARANWGDCWRMPTKEELEELYQQTTWTWTEHDGVKGRLMTGPNGNSIFFPASGFYLNNEVICLGLGIYWSNTLHTGCPERGWSLHFDFENCHVCGTYERCRGQVVRAVRATK